MIQRPRGARFLLEPPKPVRILRERSWKYLDGDFPPDAGISSAIDLPHSSSVERRDDFVWPESRSCRESHRSAPGTHSENPAGGMLRKSPPRFATATLCAIEDFD